MPDLSIETFLPHVQTEFRVADPPGGNPVTIRLIDASALGIRLNAPRTHPFAVLSGRTGEDVVSISRR